MPLLIDTLQPCVKSEKIFDCPADNGSAVLDDTFPRPFPASQTMWQVYRSSYFYRTVLGFQGLSQSSLQNPSIVCDGAGHWHAAARRLQGDDPASDLPTLTRDFRYNTLFGDTHVKGLSFKGLDDVWQADL